MPLARTIFIAAMTPLVLALVPHAPHVATVSESEPNDTPQTANPIQPGDTVVGEISSPTDVDWFAVDLQAGTVIYVVAHGPNPPPSVARLDSAGNEWSREELEYSTVLSSGRYYIGLGGTRSGWDGTYTTSYVQEFRAYPPGPGDVTTTTPAFRATQIAAGHSGEIYGLCEHCDEHVYRQPAGGPPELLATFGGIRGVAVDAFGLVLVTTGNGLVRLDPDTRQSTLLYRGRFSRLTVDARGHIWGYDDGGSRLLQMDPYGAVLDTIVVHVDGVPLEEGPYLNIRDLAFAPSGELHIATPGAILRVDVGTGAAAVIDEVGAFGIAFDVEGNIYAVLLGTLHGLPNRIRMLDPRGNVIHEPFAQTRFGQSLDIVFRTEQDGGPTSRLVTAGTQGTFVEPKVSAVPHPGFPVGARLSYITPGDLPIGELETEYRAQLSATMGGMLTLESGQLPPGLTLGPDGVISGVPTEGGVFRFIVRSEADSASSSRRLAISITPTLIESDIMMHLLGGPQVDQVVADYLDHTGNQNGGLDLGDVSLWMETRS